MIISGRWARRLGSVAFHPGGSPALTITVDPSRTYQRMVGFGASITDSSAQVLYRLDPATRAATMTDLFSPDHGDGLAVLRQPMGASEFVQGDFYTYDDIPAGETDYALDHFSVAHDQTQILPLLRQAIARNPQLKVIATPWSPPAWMKTNGSLIGGRLIDDLKIYAAYARYFVKFVKAYARAGVPVYAVTMQNEPQNRNPSGYPGTDMPVRQESALINALVRTCAGRGSPPRSSATTTTGRSTPTTSPTRRQGSRPRRSTPPTSCPAALRAGWRARPTTVTAVTRAGRPTCTTSSRTRASGSPNAPDRMG